MPTSKVETVEAVLRETGTTLAAWLAVRRTRGLTMEQMTAELNAILEPANISVSVPTLWRWASTRVERTYWPVKEQAA